MKTTRQQEIEKCERQVEEIKGSIGNYTESMSKHLNQLTRTEFEWYKKRIDDLFLEMTELKQYMEGLNFDKKA